MSTRHTREPHPWRIVEQVRRPDPVMVAAFARFSSAQLADTGAPVAVLDPGIGRLLPAELCGPAVTVWVAPGDVLFVLKATDLVRPGDVLVIDGGGCRDAALLGETIGTALVQMGCAGVVVDGAIRDADGLARSQLATFARGTTPRRRSSVGPGSLNVPVHAGGVDIEPGDLVRGDADGVVVIPQTRLGEVLDRVQEGAAEEAARDRAVASGTPLTVVAEVDRRIAELAPD